MSSSGVLKSNRFELCQNSLRFLQLSPQQRDSKRFCFHPARYSDADFTGGHFNHPGLDLTLGRNKCDSKACSLRS